MGATNPAARSCGRCTATGKLMYSNRSRAKAVVRDSKDGLHAYRCPDCDYWHVGHQNGLSREQHAQIQALKGGRL